MKINGTSRTSSTRPIAQSRATSAAYKAAATTAVRQVDSVSFLGIPENELTPKVREAMSLLLAEVDSMRGEIDEQRQRISQLEELADQDTLTPVINRRAFVRELTRVVSYGERYATPSSLLYIDLNGLKQINDTYGHPAGDAALMSAMSPDGLQKLADGFALYLNALTRIMYDVPAIVLNRGVKE